MRPIDLRNVIQNARVVEQAQAQMQHAQEFAQSLLAKENQDARQQSLNTVRNVKESQDRRVEADEHRKQNSDENPTEQEERQQNQSEVVGETDQEEQGVEAEGKHIDIVV